MKMKLIAGVAASLAMLAAVPLAAQAQVKTVKTVSYTHLTLPTILLV